MSIWKNPQRRTNAHRWCKVAVMTKDRRQGQLEGGWLDLGLNAGFRVRMAKKEKEKGAVTAPLCRCYLFWALEVGTVAMREVRNGRIEEWKNRKSTALQRFKDVTSTPYSVRTFLLPFFPAPPEARFNRLLSHDDQFAISVKSLFFLDTNRIGAVGSHFGPYAGFLLSVKR